jgi:hypothetical protein
MIFCIAAILPTEYPLEWNLPIYLLIGGKFMRTCPRCGAGLRDRRNVCPSCGARTNDYHSRIANRPPHASTLGQAEPAALDESHAPEPIPPRRPLSRLIVPILGAALTIGVLSFGVWIFIAWISLEPQDIPTVQPGDTHIGVIGPQTPIGAADKPFVDHQLVIRDSGTYTISLSTTSPELYRPYVSLLRDGNIVTNDDGSNGERTAVVQQFLHPGTYTLRVTRHGVGALDDQADYRLQITGAS